MMQFIEIFTSCMSSWGGNVAFIQNLEHEKLPIKLCFFLFGVHCFCAKANGRILKIG
jgi:hypothetical protein